MQDLKISKLKAWLLAIRPKTLWASVVPVCIGGSISNTSFFSLNNPYIFSYDFLIFLTILLTSVLLQITSNLVNDLFDFRRGSDTAERIGPIRVIQSGLITEKEIGTGIFVIILLIVLLGTTLIFYAQGGFIILLIGVFSILAAVGYTAGPFPLAYCGLGDIFAFFFFGPVAVSGTVILLEKTVLFPQFIIGCIPGFFTTAILVVNNLRDYENDKANDKKTLAVFFGKDFVKQEYRTLLLLPYLFLILLSIIYQRRELLLPFLSLPVALQLIRTVIHADREDNKKKGVLLNQCLANTGKLLAFFGILFCIAYKFM